MTDPIDDPERCFRVELDGGTGVYVENERPLAAGERVAIVTVRPPAAHAHALAHLMRDWVSAFRITRTGTTRRARTCSDGRSRMQRRQWAMLARWHMPRAAGSVPSRQRLAAIGVLRAAEPSLSPVERIAVVDAAARRLDEDRDGDLALALLRAACASEATATQAYVELVSTREETR